MSSAADHAPDPKRKGPPAEPRPSSSVLLISPQNQVLLLQRVIRDRDHFSGGHVFPGGNVAANQDGSVPAPGQSGRHEDSNVYRLAACRETFEESGILLARKKKGKGLLQISEAEREEARHKIHDHEWDFAHWVRRLGGVPDVDGLRAYTRWITPASVPRRFSTQMYVYMLPLEEKSLADQGDYFIPRSDGGKEHNSASFKYAAEWTELGQSGEILLFPPQFYLLSLLAPFIRKPEDGRKLSTAELQQQREQAIAFLETLPADSNDETPWSKKIISPTTGQMSKDGRAMLLLDASGPEMNMVKRGDASRFVLMSVAKGTKDARQRKLEIRDRTELADSLAESKPNL